jgi:hypothetical protein
VATKPHRPVNNRGNFVHSWVDGPFKKVATFNYMSTKVRECRA